MINFEDNYFIKFKFTAAQVKKNLENALRDFSIAKNDKIVEVKFNYCYTAFIKAGLALLSLHQVKTRSITGHHIKIIEKLAGILKDKSIEDIGNLMRTKRNLDFYGGGVEVTGKECREYIRFTERVLSRVKEIIVGASENTK